MAKPIELSKSSGTSPTSIILTPKRRRTRRGDTFSSVEAAEYIGVSKKTILRYCRDRHIMFMRYPGGEFRFRQSSLDQFMARCTIGVAA